MRHIERKITGPRPHWVGNGFHVSTYFPSRDADVDRTSPFILLDYNARREILPSDEPRGVGAHPHRGFETVTFAFEGSVEHHDNQGNHGIIHPGDIQWMTAAQGILHKEYLEKSFNEKGGPFHMIQLWVNLPAKDKMTPPGYQALTADQMGKLENELQSAVVYAGRYQGVKGPATTHTPMNIYRTRVAPGASIALEESGDDHLILLAIGGSGQVAGSFLTEGDMLLMADEAGEVPVVAGSDGLDLFVLSGEPIQESVWAEGPFVMNTQAEIRQAMLDYYAGKFGSHDF